MSLLLDALKKAANDKKQLAAEGQVEANRFPGKQPVEKTEVNADKTRQNNTDLILENLPGVEDELKSAESDADIVHLTAESAIDSPEENGFRVEFGHNNYLPDEALQLLVRKTNSEHRKNKISRQVFIVLFAAVILVTGGLYFFQVMQKKVDRLETGHTSVMWQVREKNSKEKIPVTSPVIKNLISNNKPEQKIAFIKQVIHKKQQAEKDAAGKSLRGKSSTAALQIDERKVKMREQKVSTAAGVDEKNIHIQKKHLADPVSVLLDNAWNKYNQGDYVNASILYKKVLRRESNNHDALLGLGAIAIQQNAIEQAQQYYFKLLKLNPEDPDAIAALSSMDPSGQSEFNELKIKELLERNPKSAPLNFALGNFYVKQKKWNEAQKAYFNAWVYERTNPSYSFNLAVSLDHLGKLREAKKFYEKSLYLAGETNAGFSKRSVKKRLQQIKAIEKIR